MVDWASTEHGDPIIERVALGDFDIALKLKDARPLRGPHAIGNVMWRSPEGQTGKGVSKPSDVFSFGLVVSELDFTQITHTKPASSVYMLSGASKRCY